MDIAVQNLIKARNRDRVMYEESIRKLLLNIERKESEIEFSITSRDTNSWLFMQASNYTHITYNHRKANFYLI
jgi:hypothetical protein